MASYTPKFSGRNQNSSQVYKVATLVLLAAMVAISGHFAYVNHRQKQVLRTTQQEMEEIDSLRQELDSKFNMVIADQQVQQFNSQELTAMLEQKTEELTQQKKRIDALLKDRANLGKAKDEIEDLKGKLDAYVAQIESFKEERLQLSGRNDELTQERDSIKTRLSKSESEKKGLMADKDRLMSDNRELEKKMETNATIMMKEVSTVGQREKSGGWFIKEESARKVDQLLICFSAFENDAAIQGVEQFYIRIINPKGETLAVESMGSGEMTSKASGTQLRYTKMEELEYGPGDNKACTAWAPLNPSFQAGEYIVEIYNKGILAGYGHFRLK